MTDDTKDAKFLSTVINEIETKLASASLMSTWLVGKG